MNKENVIKAIDKHLNKQKKIAGFTIKKENNLYIEWINDYYKNSEIENESILEKMWVLMHNNEIPHCSICGKKSIFGNFNLGYRSKNCMSCSLKNSKFVQLGKLKSINSPEIIITKHCKECNQEFSYKSRKLNNTINKHFCSRTCGQKYIHKHRSKEQKETRLKHINATNLKKYGDPWVVNSKYSRKKTKEKIGVEYSFQNKRILQKTKETLIKNTGYDNPLKNPLSVKKMIKTKIDKYGDLLIPMSKYKDYRMPSGKIIKVQGNESYALNILLQKFNESDIYVGRKNIELQIGKIKYFDKNDKEHIYYPDIYIKSENKIYEVKSLFTYNIHKEINHLKQQAVLNKNINFEFLII